jgi:uncharacterized protein (UPF0332 family)
MIEELERQGFVKKLPVDQKKINDALALAERDLATARSLLLTDKDWSYSIACNAVLQAGRALMFSHGYRPDGANQHVAVVKFAGLYLGTDEVTTFDRMRRKRNSSVYDTAGAVSEAEAEFAVRSAETLVPRIRDLVIR